MTLGDRVEATQKFAGIRKGARGTVVIPGGAGVIPCEGRRSIMWDGPNHPALHYVAYTSAANSPVRVISAIERLGELAS